MYMNNPQNNFCPHCQPKCPCCGRPYYIQFYSGPQYLSTQGLMQSGLNSNIANCGCNNTENTNSK